MNSSLEFAAIFLNISKNINLPNSIIGWIKIRKTKVFSNWNTRIFFINYEYWTNFIKCLPQIIRQTHEVIVDWLIENIDELKNIHQGKLKFEMSNDRINSEWEDITMIFRDDNPD